MEAAYGIGVQNRYALFLDDEDDSSDPYALLNHVTHPSSAANLNETGKKGSASNKSTTTNAGANQSQQNKSANQQNQNVTKSTLTDSKQNVLANQKPEGGRQQRPRPPNPQRAAGTGGANRENQENRIQRSPRNFESKDESGDFKNLKELRTEKDNRRNGFARAPRGRGGGERGRFPKREFNRHSGSDRAGVKSVEKREGAGSHNWGKIDDFDGPTTDLRDLAIAEKGTNEQDNGKTGEEEEQHDAEATVPAAEEGEQTGENENKSDEPQFKTLDEYKKEQEEKRVHTQFNIRKPGEGEDKSKWKKTYVLKKKPVAEEEEVEYEEIEVEEDSSKRRNRQVLDIEVNFRPSEGGREVIRRGRGGGPGGRGGGGPGRRSTGGPNNNNPTPGSERPRGGGKQGRGGGRGRDRGRFQQAPKFDDLNDFPSLSS